MRSDAETVRRGCRQRPYGVGPCRAAQASSAIWADERADSGMRESRRFSRFLPTNIFLTRRKIILLKQTNWILLLFIYFYTKFYDVKFVVNKFAENIRIEYNVLKLIFVIGIHKTRLHAYSCVHLKVYFVFHF